MMRIWQGNRFCVRQSFLAGRDLSPNGVKNRLSSSWIFFFSKTYLSFVGILVVFGDIWWYLVISSVFAPNMKAGKGRRYLQPPSAESHHLQNERCVVTMTVMMMVKTKLLKDLLNHCFSQEMSLRGPILSLDFNHHQFFSKRLFTLVGCRVTICVICITFNRKIRCFARACKWLIKQSIKQPDSNVKVKV